MSFSSNKVVTRSAEGLAQLEAYRKSRPGEDDIQEDGRRIAILVPRKEVKQFKSLLELQDQLDRRKKIVPENTENGAQSARMIVPTTIPVPHFGGPRHQGPLTAVHKAHVAGVTRIQFYYSLEDFDVIAIEQEAPGALPPSQNPLSKALGVAVNHLPQPFLASLRNRSALMKGFPTTYSLYKPMLLLPSNAFTSPEWLRLFSEYPPKSDILIEFWSIIAKSVGATQIAINHGIPLSTAKTSDTDSSNPGQETHEEEENILRSPTNLTPLYGDFGPHPTRALKTNPTKQDFANAFWVTTCQNGIHQTWAPLYTMFSRGNIREKTRLLNLSSERPGVSEYETKKSSTIPKTEPQQSSPLPKLKSPESTEKTSTPQPPTPYSVLDLYAGIGYFSFSYKRSGALTLLCWDINPWSIEGLKRGATLNNWTYSDLTNSSLSEIANNASDADFLVFEESNERADEKVRWLRGKGKVPPIRHVNCGLLPTSMGAWRTAVRCVDERGGGWIHAHENVGVRDVERRKGEVVEVMQRYLSEWDEECRRDGSRRVRGGHVERVKTFAPGVLHVVFDVWVDGTDNDLSC